MSEFNNFFNSNKKSPPDHLNSKIREIVMADISPSIWNVSFKFLFIHFVMSSLTLIICPQFGLGPLGGSNGILHFIEQYGHRICGLFCGSFFFLGSLLMANWILTKGQKKAIFQHGFIFSFCIVLLSFFSLLIISSMISGNVQHLHAEFIFFWLMSSLILLTSTTKIVFKQNFKPV
jgi:hypothetical protein